MLAEVEAGRADEVADVLDEHDVDVVQGQFVQRGVHHVGVEVAGAAGTDLYCRYTLAADAVRVVFRLEIALDDGNPQAAVERLDGRLEQRGLAGAGRGHQVDGEYAVAGEMFAIVQRLVVIGVQEALEHLDRFAPRPGLVQVPVLVQQVFVAGSDITAARITHGSAPGMKGQPSVAASISSNRAHDSAASSSDTFWIA